MAEGKLRVIAPAPDFADMLALAFDPLLQHGRDDMQVLGRLLDALDMIGATANNTHRRVALSAVARKLYRELQRVRPPSRSVLLRPRARMLGRTLRSNTADLSGYGGRAVRPAASSAANPPPAVPARSW